MNDPKIIKVHTLWKDKDNLLKSKVNNIIENLQKIDLYFGSFKNLVLSDTLNISVSIIEKIKNTNLNLPESLVKVILNKLKDILIIEKLDIYIHPDDEKIINLYLLGRNRKFNNLVLYPNPSLKRGECHFDYDFSKIILRMTQRSIDIKNIFLEYYKMNPSLDVGEIKAMEENADLSASEKIEEKSSIFKLLENFETRQFSDLMLNENPKIIALILINLNPEKAGQILSELPSDLLDDVVMNIASINKISTKVLKNIGKTAISFILKKIKMEGMVEPVYKN